MKARGVDISSVQAHCDFEGLKAGGFDFVIEKGTQGGAGVDPTFAPRVEAARRAGLLVPLMYHVLTVQAPVPQQVKNALSHAKDYDLDIALDFEVNGTTAMQALEFADEVTAQGVKCVVYSYPDFMRRLGGSSALVLLAQVTEYWAASYPHEQSEPFESENPYVPIVWHGKWAFWQWSGNGGKSAPGIPQVVDHNLFNGSREDLIRWMTGDKSETFSNQSSS